VGDEKGGNLIGKPNMESLPIGRGRNRKTGVERTAYNLGGKGDCYYRNEWKTQTEGEKGAVALD